VIDDGSVDEIGMAVEYVTQLERDRLARMVDDSVSYWITLEVRYIAIRLTIGTGIGVGGVRSYR